MTEPVAVEFTVEGSMRLTAEVAQAYFPSDALVAVPRGDELWLMPLVGPEGGGLLLKQRNPRGDRSVLIWEALPPETYKQAVAMGLRIARKQVAPDLLVLPVAAPKGAAQ